MLILLLAVATVLAEEEAMKLNEIAPDFVLTDQNGKQRRLSNYRNHWVVLYFYPKNNTPGCTEEACNFRDDYFKLDKLGAEVLGISIDNENSHAEFSKKYSLPFPLLADTDGKIAGLFGVPVSDGGTMDMEVDGNQMSLTRGVTTGRWTFVVDVNGKLIYKDMHVNAAEDAGTVLKFIANYDKRRSCTNF